MEEDKENFTVVSQGRLDSKLVSDVKEQAATVMHISKEKRQMELPF